MHAGDVPPFVLCGVSVHSARIFSWSSSDGPLAYFRLTPLSSYVSRKRNTYYYLHLLERKNRRNSNKSRALLNGISVLSLKGKKWINTES